MKKYDDLSREQLIALLNKRDRTKKLGLARLIHEEAESGLAGVA